MIHSHIVVVFSVLIEELQKELKELIKANDEIIDVCFTQNVKSVDFKTYIGKGKVEEIKDYITDHNIDIIQFDIDLSPLQIRNLEEILNTAVRDRSELILEIFDQRAQTKVAKLQIESARLKKLLPRLVGANTQLSKQGGGKNKGAGEKQLELDRRRVKARIHEVQKELKEVKVERMIQRKRRRKTEIPLVSLVGYTNAGKSTIMNQMLTLSNQKEDKKVLQKDMLFATLDTAVRKIQTSDHQFLLSDTVGFVSNLPHNLIDAFHSTLEEITFADLLIQVVDVSNEHYDMQMRVTQDTLTAINAAHIPMITVYNKCDGSNFSYPRYKDNKAYISALDIEHIVALQSMIIHQLHPDETWQHLKIPYEKASLFSTLMTQTKVKNITQEEQDIVCDAKLNDRHMKKYSPFINHDEEE